MAKDPEKKFVPDGEQTIRGGGVVVRPDGSRDTPGRIVTAGLVGAGVGAGLFALSGSAYRIATEPQPGYPHTADEEAAVRTTLEVSNADSKNPAPTKPAVILAEYQQRLQEENAGRNAVHLAWQHKIVRETVPDAAAGAALGAMAAIAFTSPKGRKKKRGESVEGEKTKAGPSRG